MTTRHIISPAGRSDERQTLCGAASDPMRDYRGLDNAYVVHVEGRSNGTLCRECLKRALYGMRVEIAELEE